MKSIVLSTLNSRFTHTSIALRYLYANMQDLQNITHILEFSINDNVQSIAENILDTTPDIVGIGVYIWNATEVHELISIIKNVSPNTIVVLGGPEASYTPFRVDFSQADYIIQGEGDIAFYQLCKEVQNHNAPKEQIIKPVMADLSKIARPYAYYTDDDIANRYIYVEASRGCPFLCEFCLSSIDEKVRNFELETLLEDFEMLWQRGVRNFKFIDRTFNLNIRFANKILDFFLSKEPPYFAHFEVIPDHFPDSIKAKIAQFPAGSLQLEVGIQTLNLQIAEGINRPLKIDKTRENISFLENETKAHMHLDLLVGLPGESLESFGKNLNTLTSMSDAEIQIGILKKLSGTTLSRHDEIHGMLYANKPPYDVLKTNQLDFKTIQKMKRFSRFWDLTYNSSNFTRIMPLLFKDDVFKNFYHFSLWIYEQTASTWKISLDRLAKLLYDYLVDVQHYDKDEIAMTMVRDFTKVEGRKLPVFLRAYERSMVRSGMKIEGTGTMNKRQARHESG